MATLGLVHVPASYLPVLLQNINPDFHRVIWSRIALVLPILGVNKDLFLCILPHFASSSMNEERRRKVSVVSRVDFSLAPQIFKTDFFAGILFSDEFKDWVCLKPPCTGSVATIFLFQNISVPVISKKKLASTGWWRSLRFWIFKTLDNLKTCLGVACYDITEKTHQGEHFCSYTIFASLESLTLG